MTKIKALLGFTVLVALLAISAAPAFAQYSSTSTATSGKGSAGKTTFTTGTLAVTCVKSEGEWKLAKNTENTAMNIFAAKWNECKASLGNSAKVKECEFQVKQPTKGVTTGLLGSVITGCTITALLCVITVEKAGNETLGSVSQENSGSNLKAKVAVTGITGTYKGCLLSEKLKEGKEVGEVLGEGVKSI
jgi:hypothetical protein